MTEKKNDAVARSHLTVREVAQRWGVSENFVRRLVWRQKIECTRMGRAMRFAVEDVDRYAREHTGLYKKRSQAGG